MAGTKLGGSVWEVKLSIENETPLLTLPALTDKRLEMVAKSALPTNRCIKIDRQ